MKYTDLSALMVFVKLMKNKRLADWEVEKYFNEFVPKGDYKGTPKKQILDWIRKEILKK